MLCYISINRVFGESKSWKHLPGELRKIQVKGIVIVLFFSILVCNLEGKKNNDNGDMTIQERSVRNKEDSSSSWLKN